MTESNFVLISWLVTGIFFYKFRYPLRLLMDNLLQSD